MNPDLGRWLMECVGEDVGLTTGQRCKGLLWTMKLLLPEHARMKHHDAEDDAKMTHMIYLALLARARRSPAYAAMYLEDKGKK